MWISISVCIPSGVLKETLSESVCDTPYTRRRLKCAYEGEKKATEGAIS